MKKLNPKNEKNTTRLLMSPKVKRGFRLYAVTILTLTMVMSMAMPAFAATNDPLTVVNNLSEFIFGLIRAVGLILLSEPIMALLGGYTGLKLELASQLMSLLGVSAFGVVGG